MNTMIRIALACCAGLLLMPVSPSRAAPSATPLSVTLWPEQPMLGEPFRIEVSGQWATACAPGVGPSWVIDNEIVLQLREAPGACKNDPTREMTLRSAESGADLLVAQRPGVYQVRVLTGNDERTVAFTLAEIGEAPSPAKPESGLWWPELGGDYQTSGPGLGAQIEIQGDILAVNVSGYSELGAPTWWFAANNFEHHSQRLELTSLQGGSGPFSDYVAPKLVEHGGSLHIEWLSSARAVFWFVRTLAGSDGLDIRPISMSRFSFGVRPGDSWRGEWLLLQRGANGQLRPTALNFDGISHRDDGFELRSSNGWRLACINAAQRPDSPPQHCQLRNEQGEAVSLNSIGLHRLDGQREDNRAEVSLIKVDLPR